MRPIIRATISASGLFASAKNSEKTEEALLSKKLLAGENEKRGLRRVSESKS